MFQTFLMFIIRKTLLHMQPYMVCFPRVNASSLPGWRVCSNYTMYSSWRWT